jgi:hypothetical protein
VQSDQRGDDSCAHGTGELRADEKRAPVVGVGDRAAERQQQGGKPESAGLPATATAEFVSSAINQVCASNWSASPAYETDQPIQIDRKSERRSGAGTTRTPARGI